MRVHFEGQDFQFPDDVTDDEIKKIIEQYKPAGALDSRTWKGAIAGIPSRMRAGVTAVASHLAGPDESILDTFNVSEEDKELMAKDWYGKSMQQIRLEKEMGVGSRTQLKDQTKGYLQYSKDQLPPNMTLGGQAVAGAIQSVATAAPAVGIGLTAGPLAAATYMGAASAADTMAEGVAKDKSREAQLLTSAGVGAAEVGTEVLPFRYLLSALGGTNVFTNAMKFLVAEEGTELLATMIQGVITKIGYDPNKPMEEFRKELAHEMAVTALATPMTAGAQYGLARGLRKLDEKISGKKMGDIVDDELETVREAIVRAKSSKELSEMGIPVNSEKAQAELQAALGRLQAKEMISGIPSSQYHSPSVVPTTPLTPEVSTLIASIDATLNPEDISDEQVSTAKQEVANFEAARTKAAPRAESIAYLEGLNEIKPGADLGELGESSKVALSAQNYINENDSVSRSSRQVLVGLPGEEGIPLENIEIEKRPGVRVVGVPTADRPEAYLRALQETLEVWRSQHLTNSSILLMNESLPTRSAVGWHKRLKSGVHVIVPAALRNMKDPTKFNTNAQIKTFYNLAHEFGHALVDDRFFEGIDPAVATAVQEAAQVGLIPEELLAPFGEARAAVLREFNEIKQRVISGEMTAQEFIQEWMGPAKVHKFSLTDEHYVAGTAPATQLVDAILRRAFRTNEQLSPEQMVSLRNEYLSLHEYLAEQTARYAYAKGWDQSSALNKENLFQRAFASARDALVKFFKQLKKEGILAPGVKFQEWLDGLSVNPVAPQLPGPNANGAAAAKKLKPKKPRAKKEITKKTDLNEATTSKQTVEEYRKLVTGLVRDGTIEAGGPKFKELMGLLRAGDYSTFIDEIQPMLEKKVKFELDDDIPNIKEVGLAVNPKLLIQQFGANMYSGDLPLIIMKELIQNAFDAVKQEAIAAQTQGEKITGMDVSAPIYQPKIEIKVDVANNTMQVADNGVGMTPEILQDAFLTYPGSSKVGLPPEQRSGGLGLAKVVLLFTPEMIQVQTVRDGKLTSFQGTPDEIMDRKAQMFTKDAPDANSGTVVTIKLPKEVERPSGIEKVDVPQYEFYYPSVSRGILAPELQLTFNGDSVNTTIPPQYEQLPTIDFPWGSVEMWYDPSKESQWADARVFSSGFYQFDTQLKLGDEVFPHHTILNIKPHVDAKEASYPFENNRQGLRAHASKNITEKALPALFEELYRRRVEKTLSTYSRIQAVPDSSSKEVAEFEKVDLKITSKPGEAPVIQINLSPNVALFHNNTNFDPTKDPNARRVIARLANWLSRQGNKIWKVSYDSMADKFGKRQVKDKNMYFGLMISKSKDNGPDYYGVSLSAPYQALFVNPFAGENWTSVEAVAEEIYQTFMHEIAHAWVGSHNASFANALAEIQVRMAEANLMNPTRAIIAGIIRSEFDLFKEIKREYQDKRTVNIGTAIEGVEKSGAVAGRPGYAQADRGERRGDGASTGTGGIDPATGIHFEVDEDGTQIGFGVPHAGSELSPSTLADAAGEWKKLGFRSKYFKAWFGDWEGDPAASSKVMTAHGQPLVVYHATQAKVQTPRGEEPFLAFNREQGSNIAFGEAAIGFHFGTVRAAHARGYEWHARQSDPTMEMIQSVIWSEQYPLAMGWKDQDVLAGSALGEREVESTLQPFYIMPLVLNIKNPLDLGDVNPGFWYDGLIAGNVLFNLKVIDQVEWQQLKQKIESIHPMEDEGEAASELVTRLIKSKGYDGLKYKNRIEGDTSWVAFDPEQIKSVLGTKVFSKNPSIHLELDFDEATPDGHGAHKFRDKFKNFYGDFGPFRRAFRWITNLQYKTLQLQQLSHLNPDLPDLEFMVENNTLYNRTKGALQANADRLAFKWSGLGKENYARVNNFLMAEKDSGQLWVGLARQPGVDIDLKQVLNFVYVPNELFYTKLKENRIDPDTTEGKELAALILEIKNSLLQHVNEAETTLIGLLARRYAAAPAGVLTSAVIPLRKQIHEIRKQPFFPQGRFGNYVLTVEHKREGKPGFEVVYREAFENEADWAKAWIEADKKKRPDERVRKHKLTDSEYVLMSLPQDFLDLVASELGLSDKQVEHLLDILQPVKTEKALKAYDLKRLGIKGASSDSVRGYANFMWHNSNLLAKLRYRANFNLAIRGIGAKLREAQYSSGPNSLREVDRLTHVQRYMERTRDYIMSPPNEAHMARAFVSLAYLAYNVKTALLNLYGLVTTWSDLTSRFGQLEGGKILAQASWAALQSIQPLDLNAARPVAMKAEWQAGLDRALAEGVLSQSYAYHLAGQANASNLYRLPSRQLLGKMTQGAIDLGMWTFRLTELGARRITFLAMLESELRQKDTGFSDAYTNAVAATNKLQNDYSLGNRVPFMRGIKTQSGNALIESAVPLATVFMSFAQHMAFHSYGGYEIGQRRKQLLEGKTPTNPILGYTMKIWILTLILAGYEGLPGAENLFDLLDAAWKKLSGKPMRQELRELVQSVGGDPVWWSRGMGHNVFGFDISRSLGFGRFVPGTDQLARSSTDLQRDVGTMVFDLAGPTGGMLEWMLKTAFDNKPLAEGFKRTPGAIGNVITAYSWSQNGVRAPSGALVTRDLETGQLRDLTTFEIFGKALGFNPTIVSQNREIIFEQHDARMYWMSRRQRLLQDHWRATVSKDREAIADTRSAISQFNESLPESQRGKLRITPKEIAESRKAHQRTMRLEEMGGSPHKRYRELYREVSDSFQTEE